MSFIPKPQEIYKHFKGNLYQITAIAEHTETGETLVVYQAMYGDFKTYARPLVLFTSLVDREKYPNAAQEFRFELQGPDAARQRAEMAADSQTAEVTAESQRAEMAADNQTNSVNPGMAASAEESVKPKAEEAQDQLLTESVLQKPVSLESDEEFEELNIDPLVLEFLDADSYEQRLNILAGLHHRITDDMITTMAIACDVEIEDGDVEERYESLKTCLLTMERFECNRLR